MNAEEEKRLTLVVQNSVITAIQTLISEAPTKQLGSVKAEDADKSQVVVSNQLDAMGEQGLNEWTVPPEVTDTIQKSAEEMHEAEQQLEETVEQLQQANTPPPPLPVPVPTQDPMMVQQQLQAQVMAADNVHNFPPKACPRDTTPMSYSDMKGGYYCPSCDTVNPKPSLLQRLTGGVTDLSTAAVATTGAVAGASMGVMGATMAAQGNMAQMQNQMTAGAPPPIAPVGTGVKCPTCQQDASDMSAYGGNYVGKYYCNGCKVWVETTTPTTPSATVA
jgi:hypothetical protein